MLLEVEELTVAYGDIQALSGVSLALAPGELISVLGANGAGKTSLLMGILGLVPVRGGRIRFRGADIGRLPAWRRARAGMRLVPERARVFPRLTVAENLKAGRWGLGRDARAEERVRRLLDLFPVLRGRASQPAATLSGGEQQQLAIARALVSEPALLLVDEVSMGLMPKLADEVFEVLARLNREEGLSILLVEQNAAASLAISQRAYVLETGACVFAGSALRLREDPRLKAAYLGA